MANITLESPSGDLPAYLAQPSGTGPFPGVVVIHDAFGLGNDIRNQADWLAAEGYLAIAPDLFRGRKGLACMVSTMRDARDKSGPTFDDIEAARTWLLTRSDCTGTVGVIGYCMGGGLALILAPSGGYAASSVNYGTAGKDAYSTGYLRTACPIIGSYGAKDRSLRGAAERLDRVLTEVGVDHDVREYASAGHGFLNNGAGAGDPRPALFAVFGPIMKVGYEPEAARDARARILAFFDRHLGGAAADRTPPGP
ncbi:MAG: dienelactone hydrolase family protein [Propionibacterium sp.]|nr:dienelactone hydrolase family protein [Propionibacterium sp.]